LRSDEFLIPAGGISIGDWEYNFYSAVNEEDYMPKEEKLNLRRKKRKLSNKR